MSVFVSTTSAWLRAFAPATSLDYEYFHRRSDFEIGDVGVVRQRAQQWKAFVTWNPLRDRG